MTKLGKFGFPLFSGSLSPKSTLVLKICWFTLLIALFQLCIGLLLNYPSGVILFILGTGSISVVTIILLRAQKEVAARIFFLTQAYLIIVCLTPIFGYALNTHLYLIPGVGMALIFFDNEIGWKKWLFVFAGFPAWLIIEFWGKYEPALVEIPTFFIPPLAQFNIVLTMATSIFMFYVFTKKLQEQLKTIQREKRLAEKSVERLTQFNNLLTHDMKAPLASIISSTELILGDEEMGREEMNEFIRLLDKQAKSSLKLVTGITSYFSETKSEKPSWEPLEEVIQEVIKLVVAKPNFLITVGDLPKVFLSTIVIRQLAQNLITNAIKYNDKEEGYLQIFFEKDHEIGKICFKDNGVGMTERQQKRAFELYTLFHEMAKKQSSGMGLAIARELVESNDGYIEVNSEVGKGSQFNLCFPIERFKH